MNKPLVILGSGGHAGVLIDLLRQQSRAILGLVSPENPPASNLFENIPHFNSDEDILSFDKDSIKLVNGIGSLPGNNLRAILFQRFTKLGYKFETVVADNATVSTYAKLGQGVQVMSGAIIQTGAVVGANSIVNTGSIVEHDCNIGSDNHLAPGVTISGQVKSSENVHFGTGASVIQSVIFGKNVVVGAGATVTKDIPENTICYPARITKKAIKTDGA